MTGTLSQNSTQKQFHSSQKSMHGGVTPAGSGKKGLTNMRSYQSGVHDLSSFQNATQFQNYFEGSRSTIEELTHLRS